MSDRLPELQRQRALAQEQLAWFDREIARESGQPATVPAPAAPPSPVAAPVSTTAKDEAAAHAAREIMAQYHPKKPQETAKDVKKGCYLYFFFAMGMLVICAVSIYLIYTYLR